MAEQVIELRGQFKETGQDIRLHSEGGGVAFIEFDEGAEANWLAARKNGRGHALRFVTYITEGETFGKKATDDE